MKQNKKSINYKVQGDNMTNNISNSLQ